MGWLHQAKAVPRRCPVGPAEIRTETITTETPGQLPDGGIFWPREAVGGPEEGAARMNELAMWGARRRRDVSSG